MHKINTYVLFNYVEVQLLVDLSDERIRQIEPEMVDDVALDRLRDESFVGLFKHLVSTY